MTVDYRIPPAHRRKLRRMRALVDAAASGADRIPHAEALAEAEAFLALHATCEAYFAARDSGEAPAARPRCAQSTGKAQPTYSAGIRTCKVCRKKKSALTIDATSGTCVKCATKNRKKPGSSAVGTKGGAPAKPAPTRSRKCPVCLQSVTASLFAGDWTVDGHTKVRAGLVVECEGTGKVLSQQRRDAMDHRAPGSFEGGKRR